LPKEEERKKTGKKAWALENLEGRSYRGGGGKGRKCKVRGYNLTLKEGGKKQRGKKGWGAIREGKDD